jgi:hypothetical protein
MRVLFSSRFSSEEVSAQNQVKASVQRKIRQSIAEEVMYISASFTLYSLKVLKNLNLYITLSRLYCSIQVLNQCWMICFQRNLLLLLLNGL